MIILSETILTVTSENNYLWPYQWFANFRERKFNAHQAEIKQVPYQPGNQVVPDKEFTS